MAIALTLLLGIFMGIIFGFTLEKSRVIDPEVIIGQFQLKNFIMLKVFLTAIVTGLCVFSVLFFLGFDRLNWKVMSIGPDIIGGLLIGVGVALAGACPGTVFAQIGAGYKDSLATLAGAVLGALTYAATKPIVMAFLPLQTPSEKVTIEHWLGVSFWQAALVLAVFIIDALWLLEKRFPWKREIDFL